MGNQEIMYAGILLIICLLCYSYGYSHGRKQGGVPKWENPPDPPTRSSPPKRDVLKPPPAFPSDRY